MSRKTLLGVVWDRQQIGAGDLETAVRGESSGADPKPNPPPPPAPPPDPVTKVRGENVVQQRLTEVRGESAEPDPPPAPQPDETRVRGESTE